MIHRLAPAFGGLDRNAEHLFEFGLPDKLAQLLRTQAEVKLLVLFLGRG